MSADNTVVILVTRGKRRRVCVGKGRWVTKFGKEYRIACVQASENIEYQPDYPVENPRFNAECVRLLFGNCKVFTDRQKAVREADRIYKQECDIVGYVEYGIQYLLYKGVKFPDTQLDAVERLEKSYSCDGSQHTEITTKVWYRDGEVVFAEIVSQKRICACDRFSCEHTLNGFCLYA